MIINKMMQAYDVAVATDSFAEHNKFIHQILASSDPDVVAFHFDRVLHAKNSRLQQRLRAAFVKRGLAVRQFLLDQIRTAREEDTIAECIQLLGHLRADDAVPLARHYLEDPSAVLRYKAIIVLGWMGDPDDVPLLGARFPHECVPQLRGYLATALRQIFLRLPAIADEALHYLLGALDIEQDDDALSLMIVSAQTISGASFGLKESVHEATVTGDVQRARVRAVTFLGKSQSER